MNFALIFVIGVQGAAVATAISSYIIYLLRKVAVADRIHIDNYWKVYATWALIVGQAIVAIYIKQYVIIELGLIMAFLIVNFKEMRDLALKLLNMKKLLK